MLRFVRKELEKSSVTKGFVRQQALKEKGGGGKKRVRLFCCSAIEDSGGCSHPPARLMCLYPWGRISVGGGLLLKHLGLTLSWPRRRLWWSHCPAPVPQELALGNAAQPETPLLRSHSSWLSAEGFPWRFEIIYSPHRPPSPQHPGDESVSHLKRIFHNCSEVLEEGKLTAFNSSSVLSSL